MFVLSPDQIKFNQGNLKERLEQEEKMHLEYQSVGRRAHSNNPPTLLAQELEIQMQNQSEPQGAHLYSKDIGRFNGMQ